MKKARSWNAYLIYQRSCKKAILATGSRGAKFDLCDVFICANSQSVCGYTKNNAIPAGL